MRNLSYLKFYFFIGIFSLIFSSCSEDEEIIDPGMPSVEFSSSEYKVKIGKQVTLQASVNNAVNPVYSWKLDGVIVSTDTTYTFDAEETGEYYPVFRLDAENGSLEEQTKITVSEKLAPTITITSSWGGYVGVDLEVAPTSVLNSDEAVYVWKLEGETVSEDSVCVINISSVGSYTLTLMVTNEDGMDYSTVTVNILPKPTPTIFFDNGSYRTASNEAETRTFSVPLGRSLVMAPVLCNISDEATFVWTVDGATQTSTSKYLTFTPSEKGTYTINVSATDGSATVSTSATVSCVEAEGTYYRQVSDESASMMNYVYEFIPAPGQFIDYQEGTTMQGVLDDLNESNSIAYIGAYGGYFIVGFDHSVDNSDGSDLYISGNAFSGWSEPGIVWVMQDENGDGFPNDTWYELAGSEANSSDTEYRYAITYYKPDAAHQDVLWTDNMGNLGSVDINSYHSQDYYFPMFIEEDSYTLTGTRLGSTMEIADLETCDGYDWGYVDNYSSEPSTNALFEIDNAIQADGSSIELKYIDFVKVHTAMIGKGAAVGEISCEAGAPYDYHIK